MTQEANVGLLVDRFSSMDGSLAAAPLTARRDAASAHPPRGGSLDCGPRRDRVADVDVDFDVVVVVDGELDLDGDG
jgi:hypothetical protein